MWQTHAASLPGSWKSEIMEVRLEPDEKQAFKDAASLAGLSLSTWVRERLRRTAKRELEEAGHPIAFHRHVSVE